MGSPWDCPLCEEEGVVERLGDDLGFSAARCDECRVVFAVEEDWSYDGEGRWVDYSTLGKPVLEVNRG